MKLIDIKYDAIQQAVKKSGDKFYTKDISNHLDVIHAHADLLKNWQYHAMIGKYLSKCKAELDIRKAEDYDTYLGQSWRKCH